MFRAGRLVQRACVAASRSRVWASPALAVRMPQFPQIRYHSQDHKDPATLKVDTPQMMIAFTCKKCDTRSSHTFSKQSYLKGSVLIQCPGCKNRHLIADNLKIFSEGNFNLQDVLNASGESVTTDAGDLAFEDIPESLRLMIGHHAKDAPESYQKTNLDNSLPPSESEDPKHK